MYMFNKGRIFVRWMMLNTALVLYLCEGHHSLNPCKQEVGLTRVRTFLMATLIVVRQKAALSPAKARLEEHVASTT
jgi:hypothetical protein